MESLFLFSYIPIQFKIKPKRPYKKACIAIDQQVFIQIKFDFVFSESPQKPIEPIIEKEPEDPSRPKSGQIYYWYNISSSPSVRTSIWEDDWPFHPSPHEVLLLKGNCFKTYEEAQDALDRDLGKRDSLQNKKSVLEWLADVSGRSVKSVLRICKKKEELKQKKAKKKKNQRVRDASIIRLSTKGIKQVDIAKMVGVSCNTVCRVLGDYRRKEEAKHAKKEDF